MSHRNTRSDNGPDFTAIAVAMVGIEIGLEIVKCDPRGYLDLRIFLR
jgi:hypothetical protein